jgi:hypothetical protein
VILERLLQRHTRLEVRERPGPFILVSHLLPSGIPHGTVRLYLRWNGAPVLHERFWLGRRSGPTLEFAEQGCLRCERYNLGSDTQHAETAEEVLGEGYERFFLPHPLAAQLRPVQKILPSDDSDSDMGDEETSSSTQMERQRQLKAQGPLTEEEKMLLRRRACFRDERWAAFMDRRWEPVSQLRGELQRCVTYLNGRALPPCEDASRPLCEQRPTPCEASDKR